MKLISNSLDYTIYPFVFRELQNFQKVGISATGFKMRQLLLLLFFFCDVKVFAKKLKVGHWDVTECYCFYIRLTTRFKRSTQQPSICLLH